MLTCRHLFTVTTIFFIIISGCSPTNAVSPTPIATETPEPLPSPTAIPSATAEPTLTPIPIIVRESLELAQEISPDAKSIFPGDDEYAYAFNKDGSFVGFFNPETNSWEQVPAAALELPTFNPEERMNLGGAIGFNTVIVSVHKKGLPGDGAEPMLDSDANVLKTLVLAIRGSDGILRLIEIPEIAQFSNGKLLLGRGVFPRTNFAL